MLSGQLLEHNLLLTEKESNSLKTDNMIAVFQNYSLLQKPFLFNVENHGLDLIAYLRTNSLEEALELGKNLFSGVNNKKVQLISGSPEDGLRPLRRGDVLLWEEQPYLVDKEGVIVLNKEKFLNRQPSSMAEYLHLYLPFQVTEELVEDFSEYLLNEHHIIYPIQISEDMFFYWRESVKDKFELKN